MKARNSFGTLRMLIACLAISTTASLAQNGRSLSLSSTANGQAVRDAFNNRPLSFERNEGQTDPRVKFVSRGPGYNLFLTDTEAVLSLQEKAGEHPSAATSPNLTIPWSGKTGRVGCGEANTLRRGPL